MKTESRGNTVVIRDDQQDITNFLMKLTHEYKTFEKQHIIVDVTGHGSLGVRQANAFLPLSQSHRKARRSFVVVIDTDYNKASDKLSLVPTLQEAFDTIELEEIERDLGF